MDPSGLFQEALQKFFPSTWQSTKLEPCQGGVNNHTQYVLLPGSPPEKYVLRVYNNACNEPLIIWENQILSQLHSMDLSFKVPHALPNKVDDLPFVRLSNGSHASLYELIAGWLPKLTMVEEIGRASGELVRALARCKVNCKSPILPIHEIWQVHHAVTKEAALSLINSPAFDGVREAINYLTEQLHLIEAEVEGFKEQGLPYQLIHGDLHYDNILVDDKGVTGLLDFEFLAVDWRAMELAICLSKYIGEPDPLMYLKPFMDGYSVHGRLSRAEVQALPSLIILRIVTNVLFFVGRALAGEDDLSYILARAPNYQKRVEWLRSNAEALRDMASKVEDDP